MQEEAPKANFFEKSPIKEVYSLLKIDKNTDTSKDYWYFSNPYAEEDQKLMKSGSWDYNNQDLVTNKVKNILEKVDESSLSEQERKNRDEILWFWYHHAISCAIYRYHDLEKARFYAEEALKYQSRSENHPNQITKLLDLLLHDKLEEAEQLAQNVDPDEEDAAATQIRNYKNGWKEI